MTMTFREDSRNHLISYSIAGEMTSLSRSTLERQIAAGTFPQPVQVTPSRYAFVRGEVEDWIATRVAARGLRT